MKHNVTVTVHGPRGVCVHRTHNTVCKGWHELLVRLADPEDALASNDISYRLEVGEDSTASPSYTDTGTSQKITRTDVTDFINEGTNLFTSTFLDSTEANPSSGSHQSIYEIALVALIDGTSTEFCLNHATISEIQKNSSKTATIETTLELNNDTGDS